jgi:Phosphoribosylanthranilate isomerase
VIFKICGLKEKDSLICCEANKVSFFGLVFYEKSPRNINRNKARQLVEFSKNLSIKPVGVFVNHEINDLKNIIRLLNLKYIQLHGEENQSYINEIKKEFKLKIN